MLPFLVACVVVLAVLGLGFYAVLKMKPDAFRLKTTFWRVFTFSMEIESYSTAKKLTDDSGHAQGLPGSGPDDLADKQLVQPQERSRKGQ